MSNMGHVLVVSEHAKVDCYGSMLKPKQIQKLNLPIHRPTYNINGQTDNKNCHSANQKTNRLQSGFRDIEKKIQTEQTVNRKKSGFRAAPSWAAAEQKRSLF